MGARGADGRPAPPCAPRSSNRISGTGSYYRASLKKKLSVHKQKWPDSNYPTIERTQLNKYPCFRVWHNKRPQLVVGPCESIRPCFCGVGRAGGFCEHCPSPKNCAAILVELRSSRRARRSNGRFAGANNQLRPASNKLHSRSPRPTMVGNKAQDYDL